MRLSIEGLSCLGGFGTDASALTVALSASPAHASEKALAAVPRKADTSGLAAFLPAKALRQSDHFTRMALLGAYLAVADANLTPEELTDCGLVLATGYGPTSPIFSFLDSILDFGELMASPLAFSHSVHNIPAASVAKSMHIAGPCATICQLESPVASALLTAHAWLEEGRVKRVLFGAVDEVTPLLVATTTRLAEEKPKRSAPGKIALRRELPPGEGAVFLCLSHEAERASYGVIDGIVFDASQPPDALQTGLSGSACGNIPVIQAFDLVLAALALRDGADEAARWIYVGDSPYAGSIRLAAPISGASHASGSRA